MDRPLTDPHLHVRLGAPPISEMAPLEMNMKKLLGAMALSSLLFACTASSGTSIESPDSWAASETVAMWTPTTGEAAVLGVESAPAQALDAAIGGEEGWMFAEGHVMSVGGDEGAD